jgi:ParB-like chromosome segregation protein Spo0J
VVDKRKSTGISDLLFEDVNPYGAVIGEPVSKPIERFPLESIRPDPEQPRRLLPIDLAEAVSEGGVAPAAAVREWTKRAEAETDSVLVKEIRELRRLAAAIEQHGLINPITIRPAKLGENRYIIVTGERRYWAHVLLNLEGRQIHEGAEVHTADQIRATLVPHGASIRAHQIVENLMREDINVVEKAHGLLALRQELTNDAYRRHSEDEKGKVPKLVPWNQVEKALDMSRQYRARIVGVLDLSEEAQQLVDRYNLAEATIRPIVEKLKPYPDLQLQALHQLVTWQEAEAKGEGGGRRIVPSVGAMVERMVAKRAIPEVAQAQQLALDFGKLRQRIRGALHYIEKMDEQAMVELSHIVENRASTDIVDELQALRDQIDGMLTALSSDERNKA